MRVKQKIVQGRGPSNINLGIFVCSFDVCRLYKQFLLLTMAWQAGRSTPAFRLQQTDLPYQIVYVCICMYSKRKWTELAFVHLFDQQLCFVGVFPTRQDLMLKKVSSVYFLLLEEAPILLSTLEGKSDNISGVCMYICIYVLNLQFNADVPANTP